MASNPVINITIPQGADFSETFVSTEANQSPTNLTGYSAAAKLKKHSGSSTSTAFKINITAATGEVAIALTSGTTTGLTPGRYFYDVRLTSATGAVSRLVEGMALVTAGITT